SSSSTSSGSVDRPLSCQTPLERAARGARCATRETARSPWVLFVGSWRVASLLIERLPVTNAAAKELRPRRNRGKGIRPLRQQPPERRMVPAKLVATAVPMRSDTAPEFLDLRDQLLARHHIQIGVDHLCLAMLKGDACRMMQPTTDRSSVLGPLLPDALEKHLDRKSTGRIVTGAWRAVRSAVGKIGRAKG